MKKYTRWCVVGFHFDNGPYYEESSITFTRGRSITNFMKDNSFRSWRYWKKQGWKCVKVEMTLEVIN